MLFTMAFAFVTVNAALLQPGRHPTPLFGTRSVMTPLPVQVFRAERDGPKGSARIPPYSPSPGGQTVKALQRALGRIGLYGGPSDGLMDRQTVEAIRGFEKRHGLAPSGRPSEALLARVRASGAERIAVPQSRPRTEDVAVAGDSLVLSIQQGLANIAYTQVRTDGRLGEQTGRAIADFQRHYRLPVTGKPNAEVLAKLREIGAL